MQARRSGESRRYARFPRQEQPKRARSSRQESAAAQTPPRGQRLLRALAARHRAIHHFAHLVLAIHVRNAAAPAPFEHDDAAESGNDLRCSKPSRAPTTTQPPAERTRTPPRTGTPTPPKSLRILSFESLTSSYYPMTHDKAKRALSARPICLGP